MHKLCTNSAIAQLKKLARQFLLSLKPFQSFASQEEETARPSPNQRTPFFSGNILIKVSVNNLTILKQAYFFSLSYLLATAVLKKSFYQINDRDERM